MPVLRRVNRGTRSVAMGYSRAAKAVCRRAQPCQPRASACDQRERGARIAIVSQRIVTMRKGPRNKDAGKDRSGKLREKNGDRHNEKLDNALERGLEETFPVVS